MARSVTTKLPLRDLRLCFIGDSFTNGIGDSTTLGWPGRLVSHTLRKNQPHNSPPISITHHNLGIRRETSTHILRRWEREVLSRLLPTPGFPEETFENGVIFSF
jgi:acyl-CoA thioesterase I